MAFLARSVSSLVKKANPTIFTRNFGIEFKIHSVADEETIEVEAEEGSTILDICKDECVDVTAVCGGGGSCGSCHVILPQDLYDSLPPMRDQEKELLSSVVLGVTPTSRLACMLKVDKKYAGKVIEVPLPLFCELFLIINTMYITGVSRFNPHHNDSSFLLIFEMSASNLPIVTEDTINMDRHDQNASSTQDSSVVNNSCPSYDDDYESGKGQQMIESIPDTVEEKNNMNPNSNTSTPSVIDSVSDDKHPETELLESPTIESNHNSAISSAENTIMENIPDIPSIHSKSIDELRELHSANRRQSMLFDMNHSTPAQQLLYNSSILLPGSVVKRLKTDDCKYTEADMIIERKRVALESKKESEEALALQEDTIKNLEGKINDLMKLKIQLESENEQMFKLINDVEGNMQKIADEAIATQERKWKAAMAEVVENSKIEVKRIQDQLAIQKRSVSEWRDQVEKQACTVTELQLNVKQKQTEITQLQQQVVTLENQLQTNKTEIAESEDKKLSLLQEYENRIDFFRNLYEDEKKNHQMYVEKMQSNELMKDELQQRMDESMQTVTALKEENEHTKQMLDQKTNEIEQLKQDNQNLTLAFNNLSNKNDLAKSKLQQVQTEYEEYKTNINQELITTQKKYEDEIKSLQSQIQSIKVDHIESENENLPEETRELRKQISFQEQQIQSLKIMLQKKEGEVGELLSYVEEIMKSG